MHVILKTGIYYTEADTEVRTLCILNDYQIQSSDWSIFPNKRHACVLKEF